MLLFAGRVVMGFNNGAEGGDVIFEDILAGRIAKFSRNLTTDLQKKVLHPMTSTILHAC
jgi:hypothetical protein